MVVDRSIEKDTIVLVTGISGLFWWTRCFDAAQFRRSRAGTVRNVGRHSELSSRLSEAADVTDYRLSLYSADLTSDVGWDDATAVCDYVIHTASPSRPWHQGTQPTLSDRRGKELSAFSGRRSGPKSSASF
ncbi:MULTISPECIES: hypothetical protein [Cryobacterium]|uniref:hypothetical protein n=1 Tax=Cryobacterium TaxID=69578 RepID=UPI0018E084AC|nr:MULTISPECIES: hypothetical protein [Cryobacterium]